MAAPSLTYTLTNGQTADASQVMQNFNDLLNGITDGTKDLSISALTCAGTATLNGHVNLGNSTSDNLTITASLASNFPIKTNNTYAIGGSTLGLSGVYLGNAGAGSTCRIVSASHATTRTYTLPDCGADAGFVMTEGTQAAIAGLKTFTTGAFIAGRTDGVSTSAGYIGEVITAAAIAASTTNGSSTSATATNNLALTAGVWMITYSATFFRATDVGTGNTAYCGIEIRNTTDSTTLASLTRIIVSDKDGSGNIYPYTNARGSGCLSAIVNLTGSKTYVGRITSEIISGSSGNYTSIANSGGISAVRIA